MTTEKKRVGEMTPQEKNQAIHEACGLGKQYYLMKGGYYYRPDACGYTGNRRDAGLYSEEEATRREYPHDEPVTKHLADPANYSGDLNAMHEAEHVALSDSRAQRYVDHLISVTGATLKREDGTSYGVMHWLIYHATAAQRADAFLLTIGHPL